MNSDEIGISFGAKLMSMEPIFMLLVIPFFFLFMAIEYGVGRLQKKKLYRFNDTITNLHLGIGNQAFSVLFKGLIGGVFIYIYSHFRFYTLVPSVWSLLLCVVLFDFLFYWAHRWSHEINFLWAAHLVHHQSEDYNLGVALRQSWFHNLLAFYIFLPVPLLGFGPEIFFPAAGINTVYQFWIHTKLVKKLPRWIEYVLNTPSHHRVHHGRNLKYLDKNHAGMFILWDRLFGTFQEEEEEPVYGVTIPFNSWNPLWSNVAYFNEMIAQMRATPKQVDKLRTLLAKPGWRPAELGGMMVLKEPEMDSPVYDAGADTTASRYVLGQFMIILCGLVAYMMYYDELTLFFKFLLLILMVLSTVICGAIFEQKPWVKTAEVIRLLAVVSSLNALYYLHYTSFFMLMLGGTITGFAVLVWWFIHVSPKEVYVINNG